MHPCRVEAVPCENMVHQVSVNASVAVLERMYVDKSERQHGCRDDGIKIVLCGVIEDDQARHESSNIFMPRADMIRNGPLRIPVVLSNKAAFPPESKPHEAFVADHNALQA